VQFVQAAANVADHGSLRPWRLIEIRGDARDQLGRALAAAAGKHGKDGDKLAAKPLRADLLIAVVASRKPSHKVQQWEQDATAAGVAHTLSLVLSEAGWGVMWRTGPFTRSAPVRELHRLKKNEDLLGWLYVGTPAKAADDRKPSVDAERFITQL
jgi:nitroreductase